MRHKPQSEKGGGAAVLALGLVVLTPVLYVASMGPVATVLDDWHDLDSYYAIYRPVFPCVEVCPRLADPLDRYVNWWEPKREFLFGHLPGEFTVGDAEDDPALIEDEPLQGFSREILYSYD
jgi:hypothetical protein